ncbi:MAG: hypothetical protein M1135_01035 [Candidatus Omnitrophica bacterium]|nr:hypothetical protein [Candidatus Omnitrophota bacterium]
MKSKIKIYMVITICLFISVGLTACSKKSKEKNTGSGITPSNLPEKYGQVQVNALNEGKATDDVAFLKSEIEVFYMKEGRYPKSLQELVSMGIIKQNQMPKPPEGMQFIYNPKTGNVSFKMKTP